MKDIKILWESNNPKIYSLIFEYNDRKFRIYCEHTNGTPLGFNYKCCLDIMIPDGTFHHIIDSDMVGANWEKRDCGNDEQRKANNDKAIKAFKEFVEKVY